MTGSVGRADASILGRSHRLPTSQLPHASSPLPHFHPAGCASACRVHGNHVSNRAADWDSSQPRLGVTCIFCHFVLHFLNFTSGGNQRFCPQMQPRKFLLTCGTVGVLACRPTKRLQRPVGMKLLVHTRELRLCFLSGCSNSKSTPEATLPTVGWFVFSCCWLSVQR